MNHSSPGRTLFIVVGALMLALMVGILQPPAAAQAQGSTIKINFQPDGASTPSGYISDKGYTYASRNNLKYGWSSDHTDVMRDRAMHSDQRYDTLAHFKQGGKWEIQLANGNYTVRVVIGDPQHGDTRHTLNVEGTNYWLNQQLNANQFSDKTKVVTISDGRLTLDVGSAGDKQTKINFIEIKAGGTPPPPAPPVCDPEVSLSGTILSNNTTGRITNSSTTCSFQVGMATYRKFDEDIDNQDIFDWKQVTIGPNRTIDINVSLPGCATQIDVFYGPVLMSLNGDRYGTRLLTARHINGTNYCQPLPEGNCPVGSLDGIQGVSQGQNVTGVLNIQALVSGPTTRVDFDLTGPWSTTHPENIAPYYFLGDTNNAPNGWNTNNSPAGTYTMKVTRYGTHGENLAVPCNVATVTFCVRCAPPTQVPPTQVPPTQVPPTQVPPTQVPPTQVPPTQVPPTQIPPTEVPPTNTPAPTNTPEPTATPTHTPTNTPTPTPIPLQDISGMVWRDEYPSEGQRTSADTGRFGGVTVILYQGSSEIARTLTDGRGMYTFFDRPEGAYTVVIPASQFSTGGALVRHLLTTANFGDDASDSDFTGANGSDASVGVTLMPYQDLVNVDAGVKPLQDITGLVWEESSPADGIRQGEESERFSDVTVNLRDAGTQQVIASTSTDDDGAYAFANLLEGNYMVEIPHSEFAGEGALAGYDLTDANVGDDAFDSDFTGDSIYRAMVSVNLRGGVNAVNVDAGLYSILCQPVALDLVFVLDASSSMSDGYEQPEVGAISKLDAAKTAIAETVAQVESWGNGTQVSLVIFRGNSESMGYTNMMFWPSTPLSDVYSDVLNTLPFVSAEGSTPTTHALRYATEQLDASDSGRKPVMILLTDGVPTMDFLSMDVVIDYNEGFNFVDTDVESIQLEDGQGDFLTAEEVREAGECVAYNSYGLDYSGTYELNGIMYDYCAGKPIADVMDAAEDAMTRFSPANPLTMHGIAIQGVTGVFNPDIIRYVAHVGNGQFVQSYNTQALEDALNAAVEVSACE